MRRIYVCAVALVTAAGLLSFSHEAQARYFGRVVVGAPVYYPYPVYYSAYPYYAYPGPGYAYAAPPPVYPAPPPPAPVVAAAPPVVGSVGVAIR